MKWILILFYVAALLVYGLSVRDPAYGLPGAILYTFAPFLAFISAMMAVHAFGRKSAHGRSLMLIGLGLLTWFIGDGLWFCYERILHVDPFPSLADFFYILGYPLLLAGLINEVRESHVDWSRVGKGYRFLLILVSLILVFLIGYFEIYLVYSAEAPFKENIFHIAYGVGDWTLILASLLMSSLILEFRGGKLFTPWLYLFCALVLVLAADILFTVFQASYTDKIWPYFHLIDLIWISAYVFFSFSFNKALEMVEEEQKKALMQLKTRL